MPDPNSAANLREILANLYPDEASMRRLIADVGLNVAQISLASNALNNWHAIWSEAEKNNKIAGLIAIARHEYGENTRLVAAWAAYGGVVPAEMDNTEGIVRVVDSSGDQQPVMAGKRYDIFLGYSRHDADIMRRLYKELRSAGLGVWIDETGLEPGSPSWQAAIEAAIHDARCMVVILSPDAKQSEWVEIEVNVAKESGLRIFPVLARGDATTAVLFRLRTTQRIDIRQDWQPVRTVLIPALQRYLNPKPAEVVLIAPRVIEKPKLGRRRWQWVAGIAALSLLLVGIYGWQKLAAIVAPATIATSSPASGQALATPSADTATVAVNDRLATPVIATPVITTQSTIPMQPKANATQTVIAFTNAIAATLTSAALTATKTFVPTTTPQLTDTPVPNLTTTAQTQATMQAAINLTLTALAPTNTSTLSPTATPTLMATDTATPNATATPAPGATRTDRVGAVYIWIPAGTFTMGSGPEDKVASTDEKPPHPVQVNGFWMMQKEVTNAQYTRCVEALACTEPKGGHWQDNNYADYPVTHVNWNQAKSYAEWIDGRLPTEAEWEYGCRGIDGRTYPWGSQPPSADLLNFAESGKNDTMPVGSYPAGANGLYDMAGNVWEWTADWYDENYYANSPAANPTGPVSGQYHILRGGAFFNFGYNVRCAFRNNNSPYNRYDYVGFRLLAPGF